MRAGGPNVRATIRAIWIVIAILAAIILGSIIFEAYRRNHHPSIPERQGQERAALIQSCIPANVGSHDYLGTVFNQSRFGQSALKMNEWRARPACGWWGLGFFLRPFRVRMRCVVSVHQEAR